MGADNTIALDVARTASGVEIRPGGGEPPIAWSEPAPVGPVTAYFRDDVAKLVAPDAPAEDAIVLRGRIASGPIRAATTATRWRSAAVTSP